MVEIKSLKDKPKQYFGYFLAAGLGMSFANLLILLTVALVSGDFDGAKWLRAGFYFSSFLIFIVIWGKSAIRREGQAGESTIIGETDDE